MRNLTVMHCGHVVAAVAIVALSTYSASVLAGDYSVDPGSPEVPFTYAPGDLVRHNGGAVHISHVLLGLNADDNVDAMSYGDDQVEPFGIENLVNFDYSVDRGTTGNGAAVTREATGNGAAGDKFRILAFKNGRSVGPFRLSDSTSHDLTPTPGIESDLDALSLPVGARTNIYFSLDRNGSSAVPTAGPADILYVAEPGVTPPTVFATAADLDLDPADNIDGVCIVDQGRIGELDPRDLVYVSLDRTSPTRNAAPSNGSDDVIRVAPGPATIIYDARQLDLLTSSGEELNAMTGRDPVWAPIQPNETIQERKPWYQLRHSPITALGNKKLPKTPLVYFDSSSNQVSLGPRLVRSTTRNEIGQRARSPELLITCREDDQFVFGALPDIARHYVHYQFTTTFNSTTGIRVESTTLGCELDFDTDPGTFPPLFVYVAMGKSEDGVYGFVNVNRVNVGTPINFVNQTAMDFHVVVHPQYGLDVGCREPGGTWQTLWSDPDFVGGERIMLGCGAARLDAGAQCSIRNVQLSCDSTADRESYLYSLEQAACHLDRTELLLSNEIGGGTAAPDPAGARAWINNFVVALNGSPAGAKSKSKTYPNGLIEMTRNESLGPMPESVSAKAVSGRVKKAAKLAKKIDKLLRKKKLNVLKVRKAIAKARVALDDAQELLIYGVKLP